MDIQLSERLDYLMSITNTANNMLARELSLDPSYIGRIRNGKRGIPHHQPFVEPAAQYLASRIEKTWQTRSVAERLGLNGSLPPGQQDRAALIAQWIESGNVEAGTTSETDPSAFQAPSGQALTEANMLVGTGTQGMREAVRLFLGDALSTEPAPRLLLFSDEPQGWLTEDADYRAFWTEATTRLLIQGGTIEIVHNVTRDVSEMLDAVRAWVPLYLTGRVRSWYLPRLRDGIFRHSAFVVPGIVAVSSRSLGGEGAPRSCFLTRDGSIVYTFEREVLDLIARCRPLATPEPVDGDEDVVAFFSQSDALEEVVCRKADARTLRTLAQGCPGLKAAPTRLVDATDLPRGCAFAFIGANRCVLIRLDEPRLVVTLTERLAVEAMREYLERL